LWNKMISRYVHHGYSQEALQLFEQMQQVGMKLNSITFIFVLSSCSSIGLVDEGRRSLIEIMTLQQ